MTYEVRWKCHKCGAEGTASQEYSDFDPVVMFDEVLQQHSTRSLDCWLQYGSSGIAVDPPAPPRAA